MKGIKFKLCKWYLETFCSYTELRWAGVEKVPVKFVWDDSIKKICHRFGINRLDMWTAIRQNCYIRCN